MSGLAANDLDVLGWEAAGLDLSVVREADEDFGAVRVVARDSTFAAVRSSDGIASADRGVVLVVHAMNVYASVTNVNTANDVEEAA